MANQEQNRECHLESVHGHFLINWLGQEWLREDVSLRLYANIP